MKTKSFRVYLGRTKHWGKYNERIYLTGFEWQCGWYWGGGYIASKSMHTHFDNCFLDSIDSRGHSLGNFCDPWNTKEGHTIISNGCAIWEPLSTFLDDAQFNEKEWWRIKDLYKQFYAYQQAAECFRIGGNCTAERNENEVNKTMETAINLHIETVIIPNIMEALNISHSSGTSS